MPEFLTEDQISQFKRDGYLSPFDGVTPAVARDCVDRIEAYEARVGEDVSRQIRVRAALAFEWVVAIARSPNVIGAMRDLMGPDIMIYLSAIWSKRPGGGASGFPCPACRRGPGLSKARVRVSWYAATPAIGKSTRSRVSISIRSPWRRWKMSRPPTATPPSATKSNAAPPNETERAGRAARLPHVTRCRTPSWRSARGYSVWPGRRGTAGRGLSTAGRNPSAASRMRTAGVPWR
jgi:hypothetical protein